MTDAQYAADLRVMIEADARHLAEALANKTRHIAHQFVDAIIDNQQELENVERRMGTGTVATV